MARAVALSLLLVSGAAAAAVAAPRAETAPALAESVEVRLIEVDAWATDSGRPVLDLRYDEFRLFEDGEPVSILYFSPPNAPLPAAVPEAEADPTTAPPPATPVTVAVFLDDAHIGAGRRERIAASIADWLESDLGSNVAAMLVRYDHAIDLVVPRTEDRTVVARALRALDKASAAVHAQVAARGALDRIQERQRRGLEGMKVRAFGQGGRVIGGDDDPEEQLTALDVPCSTELLGIADEQANSAERAARGTLGALAAFSISMTALPGRKLLLFVSDGLPSRPGGEAYDYVRTLCDGSGMQQGIQFAYDIQAQPANTLFPGQIHPTTLKLAGEDRKLASELAEVVARANSGGVTISTLSALGMTVALEDASFEGRTTTIATASRQRGEREDSMVTLAADTGGRSFLDTNAVAGALDEVGADLRSSYALAFSSPRASDGRMHAIRLESTRPGVRLRYRRSWRDGNVEEELAALLAAALLHGIERPGLGARVSFAPSAPSAGRPGPVLRIVFEPGLLVAAPGDGANRQAEVRVAISFRAPDSDMTAVKTKVVPIDLPALGESVAMPARVVREIGLPPLAADTAVGIALRDEHGRETGVYRLVVPGGPAGQGG